jgi:hypothetical protein
MRARWSWATPGPSSSSSTEGKTLVGAVTLSNVRRGVAETGTLGYWIGQPYAGRGHATAAMRAVVGYAFDRLKLHRLEAACLPSNHASRRVLEKSGFRTRVRARAYLKINGEWADHLSVRPRRGRVRPRRPDAVLRGDSLDRAIPIPGLGRHDRHRGAGGRRHGPVGLDPVARMNCASPARRAPWAWARWRRNVRAPASSPRPCRRIGRWPRKC